MGLVHNTSNQLLSYTSINNTSTTPLASLATFTGVAELDNRPDILVTIATDQPGDLFIELVQMV